MITFETFLVIKRTGVYNENIGKKENTTKEESNKDDSSTKDEESENTSKDTSENK